VANIHKHLYSGCVNDEDTSDEEKPESPQPMAILLDEVRAAIWRLPLGKAAGYDDLPAELLKLHVDNDAIVHKFCTSTWPVDWR